MRNVLRPLVEAPSSTVPGVIAALATAGDTCAGTGGFEPYRQYALSLKAEEEAAQAARQAREAMDAEVARAAREAEAARAERTEWLVAKHKPQAHGRLHGLMPQSPPRRRLG